VHMAKGVMRQLIDYGEVRRGQLGVQVQDLTPELARAFGLDVGRGAVIARVQPSSAAARAGLQPGDVVLRADGKPVRNASDLRNRVGLVRVGEAVTLEVLREGRRRTLTARIAEPEVHRLRGERLSPHLAGATLGEMTASELGYASDEPVVVVLEVERGTPAARAGLARGDVLTSVNRVVLDTIQDLAAAVERDPDALLINVQRGDEAYFVLLR
jgi:serine protease DegQ